jgi:transcriptional regulator with XRE-family HTH domain
MRERLKWLIEELHLTKKDFSKSIGATSGNIGDWLAGRSNPGSLMLLRIYEKHGVNINWLISGEGTPFLIGRGFSEENGGGFYGVSEAGGSYTATAVTSSYVGKIVKLLQGLNEEDLRKVYELVKVFKK